MAVNQLKAGVLLSYATLGLNNVIGLIYTPFMLRMMGQSEYGLYSLVASVVAYLTVLDFGFGNAIVRYTAKYRAEGKREEQYTLFGTFLLIYSAIGAVAFLAGLGLYMNVENLFSATMTVDELGKAKIMMLLLSFNIALTFPLSIFGSIITAYENFVFQKLMNIARLLINPLIMIPLLMLGYKAIGMAVLMTVLNLASLLINCWYCFAKLRIKVKFLKSKWSIVKELSIYSYFVFLTIIVDRLFWGSGQFILGSLFGTSLVAIFSVCILLKDYFASFATTISSVYLPRVTAMIVGKQTESEITDLFIRIGRIQFILLNLILSGFILFGKRFIELWAGPDFSLAYPVTIIFFVTLWMPLTQTIGTVILQAKSQQKFRSYLYLGSAIASIFLSIVLTKKFGIVGTALGIALPQILGNSLLMNLYYHKVIRIDIIKFWGTIVFIWLKLIGPLALSAIIQILFLTPFLLYRLFCYTH
jgi:O-antigen/teichoic acid export membrane protein